jgi:hypothetical protein
LKKNFKLTLKALFEEIQRNFPKAFGGVWAKHKDTGEVYVVPSPTKNVHVVPSREEVAQQVNKLRNKYRTPSQTAEKQNTMEKAYTNLKQRAPLPINKSK